MNNRNFRISSNLSSHGFTFAVKAEYNRLKNEGVSKTYRLELAIQNVRIVVKQADIVKSVVRRNEVVKTVVRQVK